MNFKNKLLLFVFCLSIVSLFFFSFTQIDLSLTLSRVSVWQGIEKSFQQIGYFNRPLSNAWYLFTLFSLFLSYLVILIKVKKGEIKRKTIWKLTFFLSVVLLFSYNAFSYDIFNYIFYAKIVTFYHQSPYLHKALDFPNDPMLSFMHWTHNTYPYGPFWLGASIILSLIGLNIFLLNFFLFKFLAFVSFVSSAFLIEKISQKIKGEDSNFNLAFFSLNPLVMIESLVSGHNDIFMMALALFGIYLLIKNSKFQSLIFLVLAFLIKWSTGVLFLPYLLYLFSNKFRDKENLIQVSLLFLCLGLLYALTKYEMQPWYFLWIFPFIAIARKSKLILSISVGLCFGLLLSYSFFFASGNWDPPIPLYKQMAIVLSGIIAPSLLYLTLFLKRRISIDV